MAFCWKHPTSKTEKVMDCSGVICIFHIDSYRAAAPRSSLHLPLPIERPGCGESWNRQLWKLENLRNSAVNWYLLGWKPEKNQPPKNIEEKAPSFAFKLWLSNAICLALKKKTRPQQSSTKLAIDQHLPADFYQESYSNVGWAVPIPPIPPILRFKLQNARRFSVLFHSGRDLIQILHLFIRLLTNVSIGLGEKTLCLLQPKNLPHLGKTSAP